MKESDVPEYVKALYKRMQDAMIPLVQRHSVSIAARYGGQTRHHATGTLVQFADYYFVITAAHAIEQYDKAKGYYTDIKLFIDNGNTGKLVPLDGRYQATKFARDPSKPRIVVGEERDDFLDIGIWKLDRHTVDALTNKEFLNRTNITITDDLTKGIYFLSGVPCLWSKVDASKRTFDLHTILYTTHPYPEKGSLPNFNDEFHLAICLGDNPEMPKELKGVSGCAIWKLADFAREDWTAKEAKVVGVETCVYQDRIHKAIRGTKWQWVVWVLGNLYPEIRESFNLWLPGKE